MWNPRSTASGSATRSRYIPHPDARAFRAKVTLANAALVALTMVVIQGLLGGSPGKLAMGLRVIRSDGTDAGLWRCLLRTIILPVDSACCGIVGLIAVNKTRGHRRLGDLAAGTMVIGRDDQVALILARSGIALPDRTSLAAQAWIESHRPGPTGGTGPGPWTGPGFGAGGGLGGTGGIDGIGDQIVIPGARVPGAPAAPSDPPGPPADGSTPDLPSPPEWADPASARAWLESLRSGPGSGANPDARESVGGVAGWSVPSQREPGPTPTAPSSPSLPTVEATPRPGPAGAGWPDPTASPTQPIHHPQPTEPPGPAAVGIPSSAGPPTSAPVQAPGATWDERRATYVYFDPEMGAWMQWDEPKGRWIALQS